MTLLEIAQLLGNFGEFVGAMAVFGTLVYLAVQIRETRRAISAQSYQYRSDAVSDLQIQIALSDPILEALQKFSGVDSVDELHDVEQRRIYLVHRAIMNQLDNACFQYLQGYVTKDAFDDTLKSARVYVPDWEKLGMDLRPSLSQALGRAQ